MRTGFGGGPTATPNFTPPKGTFCRCLGFCPRPRGIRTAINLLPRAPYPGAFAELPSPAKDLATDQLEGASRISSYTCELKSKGAKFPRTSSACGLGLALSHASSTRAFRFLSRPAHAERGDHNALLARLTFDSPRPRRAASVLSRPRALLGAINVRALCASPSRGGIAVLTCMNCATGDYNSRAGSNSNGFAGLPCGVLRGDGLIDRAKAA